MESFLRIEDALNEELRKKVREAIEVLKRYEKVIVAFSGGVDSTLLLVLSKLALEDKVVAVTIDYPYVPQRDVEEAKRIASSLNVEHVVVKDNSLLRDEDFLVNPHNRCYLCKKRMINILKSIAKERGARHVVDGTNKDDLYEDRPGLKAIREEGVKTPLADVGIGKEDVRAILRNLNFKLWSKPPTTCLLTRIPFGERISLDKIRRIGEAEESIREIFGEDVTLRVRDHGEIARIEVEEGFMRYVVERREEIVSKLKRLGYKFVTLDLEEYGRHH